MNQPFYNVDDVYPYLNVFHDKYDLIKEEISNIGEWIDWPEKDLYLNNPTFDWKIFPFYGFDYWIEKNCNRCPILTEQLKNIPELRTATLSKLGPKTVLKPHTGWADLANKVLRCHFGINVPEKCGIWVDGVKHEQKENQWLVFDDSKYHSGYNLSDQDRIVLLLDINRPSNVLKGTSESGYTEELQDLIMKIKSM